MELMYYNPCETDIRQTHSREGDRCIGHVSAVTVQVHRSVIAIVSLCVSHNVRFRSSIRGPSFYCYEWVNRWRWHIDVICYLT